MKVILQNFGIWENKTFEFEDSGLTLLSGISGQGKSTIFRAITYALFGETSRGTKLPTFGKKSCLVQFEFKGLIIKRVNTPKTLTVKYEGSIFEKEEAQSIINRVLGRNTSLGYIQQKSENAFLNMSPAEKLLFLEGIAFEAIPIEEIKEKIKNTVNRLENQLSRAQGEHEAFVKNVVNDPKKCEEKESVEELEKKEREMEKRKEGLKVEIPKLRKELEKMNEASNRFNDLKQRIDEIKIPELMELKKTDDCVKLIKQWEVVDKYHKDLKDLQSFEKLYQSGYQDELTRITEAIAKLNFQESEVKDYEDTKEEYSSLKRDFDDWKEQQKILQEQKEFSYDEELLTRISEELKQLESSLTYYVQGKDAIGCPHCKSKLRICRNTLELYSGSEYSKEKEKEMKERISFLTKQKTDLEYKKRRYKSIKPLNDLIEIEDPKEVETHLISLQKKILTIEDRKKNYTNLISEENKHRDSKVYKNMKIEIDKLKALTSIKVEIPLETRSEIDQIIGELKEINNRVAKNNQERKEAIIKRDNLVKDQDKLFKFTPGDQDNISKKLYELDQEYSGMMNFIPQLLKRINNRKDYDRKKAEYEKYAKSLSSLKENLKVIEQAYTNAKKFREAVLTSELLAIQSLIEEINTPLQNYLNLFFPENPITIEVGMFKENEKKGTVQNKINIKVGYRGSDIELTTLSGGERDRVNLAFTLALAELFSIPLLMIDETLSSLDREATENILDCIQKDSHSRAILVVAHQAVSGLFDHVISI